MDKKVSKELAESIKSLLAAEAKLIKRQWSIFGKTVGIIALLIIAALMVLFWLVPLVIATLIIVLDLFLPLWVASLILVLFVTLLIVGFVGYSYYKGKKLVGPFKVISKRWESNVKWWYEEILPILVEAEEKDGRKGDTGSTRKGKKGG